MNLGNRSLAAPALALSLTCSIWIFSNGNGRQAVSNKSCDLVRILPVHFMRFKSEKSRAAIVGDVTMSAGIAPSAAKSSATEDYFASMTQEGVNRWSPERFPIKVFIEDGSFVPGYLPCFRDVLVSAFDEWCNKSEGKLSWLQVSDRNQADLVCNWTAEDRKNSRGSEAGITKVYSLFNIQNNEGVIKRGTISLMTKPRNREFTPEEVQKAYLHEVGHAFGLPGHSPNPSDIMFAMVSQNQQARLTARDVTTIRHLYSNYPNRNSL